MSKKGMALRPTVLRDVKDYTAHFSRLVEMEREEEMRRHREEMERLSGEARERLGRAVLDMRGRDAGLGLGGRHLVKFVKRGRGASSVPLPEIEIATGDLVLVSTGRPDDRDPTGTVLERTGRSLTVAFDRAPPDMVYGRGLRVDLYVNDITYQRMLEALSALPRGDWCDILLGKERMGDGGTPSRHPDLHNGSLNTSQASAVAASMGPARLHLVHGPPGTGKTVTCIEVMEQFVDAGRKVLATADSNVAADNMLEMLLARGRKALRVGHPARVTPALRDNTLDYVLQGHPAYKKCLSIREEAFALKEEQDRDTHPAPRWRRGLSDEDILHLAERGRGTRGIPPDKIESMAEWIMKRRELDELFAEADRLQAEAVTDLLSKADIVCTTNSSVGSEILAGTRFEVAVIDEATQAVEPAALIPLLKADIAILAGDHRQLPPTILNLDAEREGLSVSMFERLLEVHGEGIKSLLEVQYRMHRDIMGFPNEEFYDGMIRAHPSVEGHTLADIEGYDPGRGDIPEALRPAVSPEYTVVLIEVGGGRNEETPRGSTSKRNRAEADAVVETVRALASAGLPPRDMAVITPYDAQVDLLRSRLASPDLAHLEIGSVDGFQGREKEAIVLSLVRSNPRGDLGFLTDLRRLNVSITRARRKLVIVCDPATVGADATYHRLLEHVEKNGARIAYGRQP